MATRSIRLCVAVVFLAAVLGAAAEDAPEPIMLNLIGENGPITLTGDNGSIDLIGEAGKIKLREKDGQVIGALTNSGRIRFDKKQRPESFIQICDEDESKVGYITRSGLIVFNDECGVVHAVCPDGKKICTFKDQVFTINEAWKKQSIERTKIKD